MEKTESEDKYLSLSADRFSEFEPSAVPIAPDGGIAPGYGADQIPAPLPAEAKTFICLRGPCRFYWQTQSEFPYGNPEGTFEPGKEPRSISRACLTHPGVHMDLTEDTVYDCNRWDPLEQRELDGLAERRDLYNIRTKTAPAQETR